MMNSAPVAAIDMGSNTFHLLVANQRGGRLLPIAAVSDKVGLALGTGACGFGAAAIDRACDCLERFARIAARCGADHVVAAGTSAIRDAVNAADLIARANVILGTSVRVVSGCEEARLIYAGVSAVDGPAARTRLVVDIGGGSTELAVGCGQHIAALASVELGCVRLLRQFFGDGALDPRQFDHARQYAGEQLVGAISMRSCAEVVGCSGTLWALAEAAADIGCTGLLSRLMLETLRVDLLRRFDTVAAVRYPSLADNRGLLLAPGLAIALGLYDAFAIDALSLSSAALREGLAADYLGRGIAGG